MSNADKEFVALETEHANELAQSIIQLSKLLFAAKPATPKRKLRVVTGIKQHTDGSMTISSEDIMCEVVE